MNIVNPAGGGGLGAAKLALANAAETDVVSGKKFYAGDKTLKTGTLNLSALTTNMTAFKIFTANGTFTAPMTGKYKVTCIGKGGNGGQGKSSSSKVAGGGGGGAGGAAQSIVSLTSGQEIIITVSNAVSSFGSMLSATAGANGYSNEYGGNAAAGGIGSGGNLYNFTGGSGGTGSKGDLYGSGWNSTQSGGSSGTYTTDQAAKIKYLSNKAANGYYTSQKVVSDPSDAGLLSYGVAGAGGGCFHYTPYGSSGSTWDRYSGGTGNSGAVIVEFLVE